MSPPVCGVLCYDYADEAIHAKVKRIKAKQAQGGRAKREQQQLVEPSVNSKGSSDVKVSCYNNSIACVYHMMCRVPQLPEGYLQR